MTAPPRVIYTPQRSRYLLQKREATPFSLIGWCENPWENDRSFSDRQMAERRADHNTDLFLGYEFRVVDTRPDTQPEGEPVSGNPDPHTESETAT